MTKLPDFVNIILTNEFEDDPYWVEGIENDLPEAYHALTTLSTSPADPATYLEGMEIYKRYIPDVIEYYGGQRAIDAYFNETGKYPKGYILPPKLKMKKRNMNFAKTGYVPPKIGEYISPITDEELVKLGEEMYGVPDSEAAEIRTCKPSNKALRKRLKKTAENFEGDKSKPNDIYGSHANLAARYNVIAQYYENVQQSNSIDSDAITTSKMSISELADLYDAIQREDQEEWVVSKPSQKTDGLSYYGHRVITSGKLQAHADWLSLMVENGFAEYARKYLKKFDDADRKYLKSQTGISFQSKKELKKKKKLHDDYQKALNGKKSDHLRSLSNLLTRRSSGVSSDVDSEIFDSVIKRMKG